MTAALLILAVAQLLLLVGVWRRLLVVAGAVLALAGALDQLLKVLQGEHRDTKPEKETSPWN